MLNKIIIITAAIFYLSGCAKLPNVTPVSSYAYLSGKGKNDFSLAIDFKNPFSKSKIEFVSLDTIYLGNYNSSPSTLNITPGIHTVVVKCQVFASKYHLSPKHKYSSSKTINMYFEKDTAYSFTGFLGNNRQCQVRVTAHKNQDIFTNFSTKQSAKSYSRQYISKPNNKAFAQSPTGFWAWSSNKNSISEAEQTALESCKNSNSKREDRYPCQIIDINGNMVTRS